MSRHVVRPTSEPHIDLDTVRETLAYMHADTRSSERLAGVHVALGRVLEEIAAVEVLEAPHKAVSRRNVLELPTAWPRFVPWSPK